MKDVRVSHHRGGVGLAAHLSKASALRFGRCEMVVRPECSMCRTPRSIPRHKFQQLLNPEKKQQQNINDIVHGTDSPL